MIKPCSKYEVVVATTATAVDNNKSTSTTEANYGQIYNLYSVPLAWDCSVQLVNTKNGCLHFTFYS